MSTSQLSASGPEKEGTCDEVVLRVAQKVEVSEKSQLGEAKENDEGSEMEDIDEEDLRNHIKEQLLSANPIFRDGRTALHRATASGLGGVVARLLATCPFLINLPDEQGKMTALHIAAHKGHTAIAAQLLAVSPALAEARTDEDLMRYWNWTALHFAASGGHAEIVAQLLAANPASIDAITKYGETALHCAASNGHAAIVAQLLAAKPELIDVRADNHITALHFAVSAQHEEVVAQLLAAKPELIEVRTVHGMSILKTACVETENHEGVAARLIAAKPALLDEMVNNDDSWTALENVIALGHVEAIDRVLARHPNLIHDGACRERGWTVFHYAARYGRDKLMSRLLAIVSQPDRDRLLPRKTTRMWPSLTALHMAAMKGNCSIIEQLLTACPALIYVLDGESQTCLHSACGSPLQYSAIKLLLAYKPALIHSVDAKGNTILHLVLYRAHPTLAESVWKLNPAALHAVNDSGETPFSIAVRECSDSAIDLVQGSLTFEEIESAYNKFIFGKFLASDDPEKEREQFRARFVERFKPLLGKQCEELAEKLLPDVVAIVLDYLLCAAKQNPQDKPIKGTWAPQSGQPIQVRGESANWRPAKKKTTTAAKNLSCVDKKKLQKKRSKK